MIVNSLYIVARAGGRMGKSLPLLEVNLAKRPPMRPWTLRSRVVAVTRCLQSGHNGAYVIVLLRWNAEESVTYAANVFSEVLQRLHRTVFSFSVA
jgi:hypothetical protein